MLKQKDQGDRQLAETLDRIERQLAKNSQQRGGFGSMLRAFLFGSVVGAGLAVLYAPQAGAQTRQKLSQTSGEWMERATQFTDQAQDQVITLQAQAQEKLSQAKEQAQSMSAKAQGQAQDDQARGQRETSKQ